MNNMTKFYLVVVVLALILSSCVRGSSTYPTHSSQSDADRPAYARWTGSWVYHCYAYDKSDKANLFVHGKLFNQGKEVNGSEFGEEIDTDLGVLVWRGSKKSNPEDLTRNTGWFFRNARSGPACIRDQGN